jgi:hypothetical protein
VHIAGELVEQQHLTGREHALEGELDVAPLEGLDAASEQTHGQRERPAHGIAS